MNGAKKRQMFVVEEKSFESYLRFRGSEKNHISGHVWTKTRTATFRHLTDSQQVATF